MTDDEVRIREHLDSAVGSLDRFAEEVEDLVLLLGEASPAGWAARAVQKTAQGLAADLEVAEGDPCPVASEAISHLREAVNEAVKIAQGAGFEDGQARFRQLGHKAVNDVILVAEARIPMGGLAHAVNVLRMVAVYVNDAEWLCEDAPRYSTEAGRLFDLLLDDAEALPVIAKTGTVDDAVDIALGHLYEVGNSFERMSQEPGSPAEIRTAASLLGLMLPGARLYLMAVE